MDDSDFLEMGRPAPDLRKGAVRAHAYCDNLNVLGTQSERVQRKADTIIAGIESSEFVVHEREEASRYALTVGMEINGLLGWVAAKPVRRWKLRLALRWLASRPVVSGKQVERALGHAVFVLMAARPLLSIFRRAYDFVGQRYQTPTKLWKSVAEEFEAAAALMPTLDDLSAMRWFALGEHLESSTKITITIYLRIYHI